MATPAPTQPGFKIVPRVAKPTEEKIRELRQYLAANIDVSIADGQLEKAAVFQQHLDTVDLLVENSRDRI